MTRLPLEGYREHCETKTWIGGGRPDLVSRAARAGIPRLPHVDELRRPRHEREAGARHGLLARGARDVHGRGRHAARGARGLRQADLPDDAVALRPRPRAPAHGRRDRDRRRAGREARHRRDAARHEGEREGRRDAHAAGRRRPALGGAPPRLPGRRRPRGQDRGAARGHRLPRADHPQARRLPRGAGRQDRRQDRLRRDRRRRHGGLDRGLAGVPARPHGRADADGDPGRAPRARGDRHVRQDHADRLGRHPQRRRRRQGAGARRRLRRDRHRRR